MKKKIKYVFVVFLFITGCTNELGYSNDDVAAIVKDEEITVGELRFLYPDEKVVDRIEDFIKFKLVIQEVMKLNIDISEVVNRNNGVVSLPPESNDDPASKSIREFAEIQAEKLGMEPEKYHERYLEVITRQNAYMVAYMQEMLGVPEGNEDELSLYNEKVNNLLNELVEENEDEIEIFIK